MGGGGTGKSVVSAELLRRLRARGDVGLAWHFCRHDDAAGSTPRRIVETLAAQLCARRTCSPLRPQSESLLLQWLAPLSSLPNID